MRDNITVGSSYSYGDTVNYSAQASFKDILSETNQYKETSGTSFSTPIVSAIIARLLAYDNTLTKTQIMTLLDNNSTVLPNGYGRRINVKQLVESFGITFENKKIKYSGSRNDVVVEIEIARKDGAVIRKVLKYIYINNDRAISIHKELPL
jgi:subtilisin family serine protease